MKYIGKKYLNSNMYKKLRIKEKDGELLISVIPDEIYKNIEFLKTSMSYITDVIIDLTEEEKLVEIIKYFLRNNTICSLIQKGNEIMATSISGRQLVINLPKKYSSILKLILDKYQNDRLKFLNETDINEINITYWYLYRTKIVLNESSYGVKFKNNKFESEIIHLNLMNQNSEIVKFDLDFVNEYLKNFIINNPNCIHLICDSHDMEYGLFDRVKKIYLPLELFQKCKTEVIKHNKIIENGSKKQMCLDLRYDY